jgi:hypothetical protein
MGEQSMFPGQQQRWRRFSTALRRGAFLLSIAALTAATPGVAHREEKVVVCHYPPGNPANAHTMSVCEAAVSAHLNHGATIWARDRVATRS